MPRVTQAEVRDIAGLPVEAGTAIDAVIPISANLVDTTLVGQGLSEATLKNIELYLSAHFATLAFSKGPLAAIVVGEASERYHNIYGGALRATWFGQQAMMLDSSGKLSELSVKADKPSRQAEFTVVGDMPSSLETQ